MQVIKRDGRYEDVSFDKVAIRIKNLCFDKNMTPLNNIDHVVIARETIKGIYSGVSTKELDDLSASIAEPMAFDHPEYGILASRILISNYHKNTITYISNHLKLPIETVNKHLFYYTAKVLYENIDENGEQYPLIAPDIFRIIEKNKDKFEDLIDYLADYKYDYAGFKLLEESYLQKCSIFSDIINQKRERVPIERPQHLLMRVALGIHCSKEYRNFNKMRQNDKEIFNELKPILEKHLSLNLIEKINKKSNKNEVDWKDIIQMLYDTGLNDLVNPISNIFKKHTISWNQLLNKFDGLIDDKIWEEIVESYLLTKDKRFTHATPTLFNAGTLKPQLSSCFLIQMPSDSLEGINKYWKICSIISKWAGGVGSHVHNIRAENSYIRGTNGKSNGLVPLMKVVNDISVYIDQGGGKRPGSHAVYLELWHADIFNFINLKKPRGNDSERARSLFYAMWISDEFMRTVEHEYIIDKNIRYEYITKYGNISNEHEKEIAKKTKSWYLMCPDISKNLSNLYDIGFKTDWITDEMLENPEIQQNFQFTYQYRKYIKENKYVKRVSAVELWKHICEIIIETGIPYIAFKDSSNRKSNQKNLGTIKSSNLCMEILEFSSAEEVAVCNLSSTVLTSFITNIKPEQNKYAKKFIEGFADKYIDWNLLEKIIRRQVRNINKIVDVSFYPVKEAKYSNMKNRPIAIGVQDFANMLTILKIPYDSDLALELDFYLYEFIYFIACDESCELAIIHGSYESFKNSPASKGLLQFDLWLMENPKALNFELSLQWNLLKEKIQKFGMRNSLLLALMPTGSTSTIMNCSPSFEPHNALIYKRKNRKGEFTIINKYLINDLINLGLWNKSIKNEILLSETGSIGNITKIPKYIRDIYKTCWEISPKITSNMSLSRGVFIDQSQSYNVFMKRPDVKLLTQFHFYGWRRGAKVGSYYTRRLAVADASKLQIEKPKELIKTTSEEDNFICEMKPGCKVCEA